MKKIRFLNFAYAGILCLCICLCLSMKVNAETNSYRGIDYSGSVEEVEELEALLRSEGYVCVSTDYTDNAEWTETLYNDHDYAYWYFLPQDEYRVYVYPLDYEHYLNGNKISLTHNTYICDYHIFNSANEEGNCTGFVGNAIPDYMTSGTIQIKVNIPDEFKEQYPNAIYTIILFGYETKQYYDLSASMIGANDYIIIKEVPTDYYYIYSAYVSYEYPCVNLNDYADGFKIVSGLTCQLELNFEENTNLPQQNNAMEYNDTSDGNAWDNGAFPNLSNGFSVSEETSNEIDKTGTKIILIIAIFGLIVFGGYAGYKYFKKKNGEENDDELW